MTRTPSEKSIVDAITKYLRIKGAYVVKQHGSQYGRAGVPDLLVCYKGRFFAFEVKKPEGTVSMLQKIEIGRVQDAGGIACVVYGVEQVKGILNGS